MFGVGGLLPQASAWGLRGHQSICESATFLVKEAGLKEFLAGLGPRMGHLCNIPDIHWRNLSQEQTQSGNPTHYINPENVQRSLQTLETRYSKIQKLGGPETHSKVGSIWWRVDQFFERASEHGRKAKKAAPPKNSIEEQDAALPYNNAVYEMHVSMGVMGHFVADASMPFHNRVDYDGRAVGHGGIHAFYEDTCVNTWGADLSARIVERASSLGNEDFLKTRRSVVERMKALSLKSAPEAEDILRLDVILEPSGAERRVASRKAPAEACPVYQDLMLVQMARSARLLAQLWDEIYVKAGRPPLKPYKSYRYPLQPDFVAPDYL